MNDRRRVIYLDRRTCIIDPDRIDIRPANAAALVPLLGVFVGLAAFIAIPLFLGALPFAVVVLLLLVAIITLPLSGVGLVYAVAGSHITADRAKQSIVWQQGFLGMGIGTEELVPFWKVAEWVVAETTAERRADGPEDIAQYEVALVKTSGRRLPVATATMPRSLRGEALGRARQVAEALAAMTGRPLTLPPSRRRRRSSRRPAVPAEQVAS